MEKMKKCTVGVVGAGMISDIYLKNMIEVFEGLDVAAIASLHMESARKKAAQYRIRACTVEELLADESIEMIVNLTPLSAHYEIIKAAILAGKHVYTEKTITDDLEKTGELLRLAEEKGVALGSAPDTFLGAGLQTAKSAIDGGLLGQIHSFVISATRCNELLLSFIPFLRQPNTGVLNDYAVYYITALVSLLGPVERVGSIVSRAYAQYENRMPMSPEFGKPIDMPNESQVSAIVRLKNGITGTLHVDADSTSQDEAFFAIYGTKGILYLTNPNEFGGQVRFLPNALDPRTPAKETVLWNFAQYQENSRGIGPAEMAAAISEGRACRPSKEMAFHVQEVLKGILDGGKTGAFVDISSTCNLPEPLPRSAVGIRNIGHVSFHVKNMEAMLHFYRDVLGMQEAFTLTVGDLVGNLPDDPNARHEFMERHIQGKDQEKFAALPEQETLLEKLKGKEHIRYLKLADGQFLELFSNLGSVTRTIENRRDCYGYQKLNYEVEDITAIRDRLSAANVKLDADVHVSLDGSRELTVHDPDGNEVQFTQYSEGNPLGIAIGEKTGRKVCSHLAYTTQVAYQVKDAVNMERFYCLGLGLKKVFTLTYGHLAEAMAHQENGDPRMLMGMRVIKDEPWLDFIEVAPHQYIELFHTAGKQLKEDRNLSDAYGFQHICLEVEDIQAAYRAVVSNGIRPETQISLGADGAYQFWLVDPDGNRLELMEYAPGAKQNQCPQA